MPKSRCGEYALINFGYDKMMARLAHVFAHRSSDFTAALDIWTDPSCKHGYLGAVLHFLDENFESQKVVFIYLV